MANKSRSSNNGHGLSRRRFATVRSMRSPSNASLFGLMSACYDVVAFSFGCIAGAPLQSAKHC
jgi:hypothetical protein